MIKLIKRNQYVELRGVELRELRALEAATSYLVSGYYFSPAFRARRWDGREHLIKRREGKLTAPIGLLEDVVKTLEGMKRKFKIKDKSINRADFNISVGWNKKVKPRWYQEEAAKAFLARGRGILKMPIRSGKTKTAGLVIFRLQKRTLFLVPSQLLLRQTAESLAECMPDADIGLIGDGEWQEGKDITVATMQSVALARGGGMRTCKGNFERNDSGMRIEGEYKDKACVCGRKKCNGNKRWRVKPRPEWANLRDNYDLLVMDEAHHLTGETWHETHMDIKARFRLALSATAFLSLTKEVERGVIWLKACCGDIVYDVPMSDLVEQGYLMRQNVKVYRVTRPDRSEVEWSANLHDQCIYLNPYRNAMIAILARHYVDRGLKVLIVTNRKKQIEALVEELDQRRVQSVVVTGAERGETRQERIEAFKGGYVDALVGTVFGEGVDIPEVEVLINAEGGTDLKSTIQRMRNMTPAEGKTKAILVDFWDDTNPYFTKHSRARMKAYTSEPAFRVRRTWLPKSADRRP